MYDDPHHNLKPRVKKQKNKKQRYPKYASRHCSCCHNNPAAVCIWADSCRSRTRRVAVRWPQTNTWSEPGQHTFISSTNRCATAYCHGNKGLDHTASSVCFQAAGGTIKIFLCVWNVFFGNPIIMSLSSEWLHKTNGSLRCKTMEQNDCYRT